MVGIQHEDAALASEALVHGTASADQGTRVLEIAEVRELPPSPEALEAGWLRVVAWLVPGVAAAALGAWAAQDAVGIGRAIPERQDWWLHLTQDHVAPLRVLFILAVGWAATLVAILGIRLSGRRAGLAAGMLFAFLPSTSAAVRELRPEVFLVTITLASTLLALSVAERATRLRSLVYAASVLVIGVLAPLALIVVLAHVWIFAAAASPRRRWLVMSGAVVVVGVALSLGHWQLGFTKLLPTPYVSAVDASPASEWAAAVFGGAVVAGAVLGLSFLGLTMRGRARTATILAVVPTTCLLILDVATSTAAGWLLLAVPAWCLVAGIALRQVRWARGICAVCLVGLLGVPAQLALRYPPTEQATGPSAVNQQLTTPLGSQT